MNSGSEAVAVGARISDVNAKLATDLSEIHFSTIHFSTIHFSAIHFSAIHFSAIQFRAMRFSNEAYQIGLFDKFRECTKI